MQQTASVYILASRKNGTLSTGMSSDLTGRIYQHKRKLVQGFTQRYGVHQLVYYKCTHSIGAAIEREKQIKAGSRKKKIALIEGVNPHWRDLYPDSL